MVFASLTRIHRSCQLMRTTTVRLLKRLSVIKWNSKYVLKSLMVTAKYVVLHQQLYIDQQMIPVAKQQAATVQHQPMIQHKTSASGQQTKRVVVYRETPMMPIQQDRQPMMPMQQDRQPMMPMQQDRQPMMPIQQDRQPMMPMQQD